MLLWTVMLACVGGVAFFRTKNPAPLILFSVLNFGFVLFLVMTCDPFAAALEVPQEGNDLNPLLQDPLLAIHPPFLYFGYVCTAVLFAQGLLTDEITHWRRWALISWTSLTIGLGLGSFWAYYELGWGGWWFWDPVENVALIPWLLLTALLHTLLLSQWNEMSLRTARWLSYFSFASCLGGTFIVRSGLLTSVHSFAIDPERGLFLGIFMVFVLIPGAWMMWRRAFDVPIQLENASAQGATHFSTPFNLPTLMTLGIVFLILGAVIVAFGTLYPVILEAFNQSITVGSPYFKATFVPIMLPILAFMAIQPWVNNTPGKIPPQAISSFLIAGLTVITMVFLGWLPVTFNLVIITLSLWLFLTMVHFIVSKIRVFPLKKIAMITAHTGLAIAVLGMVLTTMLESESLVALREGESTYLAGHTLILNQMEPHKGPNYMAQRAILRNEGGKIMTPEKRFYWTQGIIHNETAIQSGLFDHLYVALGERYDNDSWSFRLYHKPWINLIWTGIALMALGGFFGFCRRRLGLLMIIGVLILPQTQALEVHEQLPLQALEIRAKSIGDKLICPTCVGQSLNDSAADEAQLLREVIRQQILKGQSDQQIMEWFVDRYGDRVLLAPPFAPITYLLWAFPWLLLLVVGSWIFHVFFTGGRLDQRS